MIGTALAVQWSARLLIDNTLNARGFIAAIAGNDF